MKKTIKHADGREETIEGTAEEIADYERKLNEENVKGKGKRNPKLLNEDKIQEFMDRVDEFMRMPRCAPIAVPYYQPLWPIPHFHPFHPSPYWDTQRSDMPWWRNGEIICGDVTITTSDLPMNNADGFIELSSNNRFTKLS